MLENNVQVAPSILSADLGHLADELASIEGAGYVHFDAMDGHFVPNLTFGPGVLAAVKEATQIPVDAHLMISNPDQMVPEYLAAGADIVTFHYEATAHANRLASLIREKGAKAGIAINPGTPVSALDAIIEDVDLVLVMTVNPGFGGQKFIPGSLRKLRQLKAMCDERRVSPIIEVDGGIFSRNCGRCLRRGRAPARCWQRRLWQGKPRRGHPQDYRGRRGRSHEESVRSVTNRTTVYLDYAASAPAREESLVAERATRTLPLRGQIPTRCTPLDERLLVRSTVLAAILFAAWAAVLGLRT